MPKALLAVAAGVAIAGGLFNGLFACAAYSWQAPLITCAVVIATAPSAVAGWKSAPSARRGFARSIAMLILVGAIFILATAIGSTFYPSAPSSFGNFLQDAAAALQYGPCR